MGSWTENLKFLLHKHPAWGGPADLMDGESAKWLTEVSRPTVHAELRQVLDAILAITAGEMPRLQRDWSCDLPSGTLVASLAHRDEIKRLLDRAMESGSLEAAEISAEKRSMLSIRLW